MSYRSFEEAWQDIKKLEGKDVFTLCKHHKNHILKVDEKEMKRLAEGKDVPTSISKARFERAWKKLVEDRKFGYKWLSFIFACIAHLPEVEYFCKDGVLYLYLRQQNTHPLGEVKEYTE